MIDCLQFHIHHHNAAQRIGNRRQTRCQIRCIGQHNDICVQTLAVGLKKTSEIFAPDLFLPVNDHFHVERESTILEVAFKGREVDCRSSLVVDDTASVKSSISLFWLERRRLPAMRPPRWLHIVMSIQNHRRCVGACVHPLAVYVGVYPFKLQDLNAF